MTHYDIATVIKSLQEEGILGKTREETILLREEKLKRDNECIYRSFNRGRLEVMPTFCGQPIRTGTSLFFCEKHFKEAFKDAQTMLFSPDELEKKLKKKTETKAKLKRKQLKQKAVIQKNQLRERNKAIQRASRRAVFETKRQLEDLEFEENNISDSHHSEIKIEEIKESQVTVSEDLSWSFWKLPFSFFG